MRSPRSPNDTPWLARALEDTEAVLRDHAHAERKAAATAMGLVVQYADIPELVEAMVALAIEELEHFQEVFGVLQRRGIALGPDPGDPYARALIDEVRGTREERLLDRLLVGALIEARSCRRLALLGQHHGDAELAEMWTRLARAEASHGPLFLRLARQLGPGQDAVDARYAELEAIEASLIDHGPIRAAVH
ncbi:MAG: tRNA isopentenyl-2-thiomethyl-A-37 hydroxylase MiaE [Myxococcota bacterium]|jgi:tRNA-(ms[2]io[6]A)-hydroxylase|nr:tRNA isopentenyl-2-thiomethyl-A-37 hydroxylase MiaE [Myxococcota bacterium]